MKTRLLATIFIVVLASVPTVAQEEVDLEVIHRIKTEAFKNSLVMDHLFHMTEVIGPRLTGSPSYKQAAQWTVDAMKAWGIENARLEAWGPFGRGWSYSRLSIHMIEPTARPLSGLPLAWSSRTEGPVQGEVVLAPLFPKADHPDTYDLEKFKAAIQAFKKKYAGQLKGKFVLMEPARPFEPPTEPASARYDEEELAQIALAPDPKILPPFEWPITKLPSDPDIRWLYLENVPVEAEAEYWELLQHTQDELNAFLRDEGVAVVLAVDTRGSGGIIFAESLGSWESNAPKPPPSIVLLPEQYNRIVRLVEKKIPVKLELELDARFHEEAEGLNVVAEIPGTAKKDELVMLGGHLDSWHIGTGAADNAAGCAVAMEALRILKVLGFTMDRTVRLGLWDGEEQNYYGSRGYVKKHFGDPLTMSLKPDHGRISGYFNVDNGTGKIRGIYLQENEMARPIFEAWMEPFRDLGAETVSIRKTGGTDHLAFDSVGIPGFQFIQDPHDYETRTHHSNLDVYDHVLPSDLMQASAILASFVYHAAVRGELLPRKPLPKPLVKEKSTSN
jgi:hypothetical protein